VLLRLPTWGTERYWAGGEKCNGQQNIDQSLESDHRHLPDAQAADLCPLWPSNPSRNYWVRYEYIPPVLRPHSPFYRIPWSIQRLDPADFPLMWSVEFAETAQICTFMTVGRLERSQANPHEGDARWGVGAWPCGLITMASGRIQQPLDTPVKADVCFLRQHVSCERLPPIFARFSESVSTTDTWSSPLLVTLAHPRANETSKGHGNLPIPEDTMWCDTVCNTIHDEGKPWDWALDQLPPW
jgi:hypothetical protein